MFRKSGRFILRNLNSLSATFHTDCSVNQCNADKPWGYDGAVQNYIGADSKATIHKQENTDVLAEIPAGTRAAVKHTAPW